MIREYRPGIGLLAAPTPLHDVVDVEAFCSKILDVKVARFGGFLRPDQREDALDFLLVTACGLAAKYDASRGLMTFREYAGGILANRVTDWYRATHGDSRANGRRSYVSLELLADDEQPLPGQLVARSHEEEVLNRVALGS